MKRIKFCIFAFVLYWITAVCIDLTGDHICHRQENYTETINLTTNESIKVRKNFWCVEKIRCSEMQPETKEVVHAENVTRSRVIKFCCPGYEEFESDGKKICKINDTEQQNNSTNNKKLEKNNSTIVVTEKNPYLNYSGEYGKDYNHYMKMGINESDAQQSVNKLVELEIKKAKEEFGEYQEPDGYILVDVSGNEVEPLKHPHYITDHHALDEHHHHEENVAMVTVGCLVFAMLMFLVIMLYIMRRQSSYDRDIEEIDPKFESRKSVLPPSKIVHQPLPIPPLRPSLRKHKSVTFDNSIDEVDEFNRRRTKSLPDAYDTPRKQTSMIDLYAQTIKITPQDFATYALSQKNSNGFHTFPKKSISRKQSLEHIYDEIPTPIEIKACADKQKSEHVQEPVAKSEVIYANEKKNDGKTIAEEKTRV